MSKPLRTPRLLALSLLLPLTMALAQGDNAKAARFYEDALARYEKKDIDGAIIQLKNALQINKAMLPVQVLLGKALLANSDPIGAELAFTEALRLGVSRVEVIVPLAQSLVDQGKHSELVDAARFDPAGLPTTIQKELLLIKAVAYVDMGLLVKAQQVINEARALMPSSPDTWLAEAPLRLRSRQFNEAMAAVDRALALAPQSAEAYFQRGKILHAQGKLPEALAAYDKALAADAEHLESTLTRSGIYLDMGRDKEAQRDIDALLVRLPNEPRAVYLKALLAERAGDRVASKEALARITNLMDPVSISFIRYRPQLLLLNGLAHFSLGQFEKAKPYLEAAARVQGPSPIAKMLANIYVREKAPEKAVEVLEAYLRTTPEDAGALTQLASVQLSQGRHARATNLMREALKARNDPSFRTVLGLSLLRGGQDGDGQDALELAFKTDPKQVHAGTALVALYLRDGKAAKAVSVAEALVRHHPRNASLLVLQGTALSRSGAYKPARQAFEAALKLEPKLVTAHLGIAHIDMVTRAYPAAAARLTELHKADERNIDVQLELAGLAEAQGKPEEMQRWLSRAEDVAGLNDVRPNLAMVHLHLKQGLKADALQAARRLVSKAPEDPVVLILYARVQLLNADTAGARVSLNAASRRAGADVAHLMDIAEMQLQIRDLPGASYSIEKLTAAKTTSPRAQGLMAGVEMAQGDLARAERRAAELVQQHPKLALGHHLQADIALAQKKPAAALGPLRRAYQLEPNSLSLLRLFSVEQALEGLAVATQTAEAWLKQNPRDTRVLRAIGDAHARERSFATARKAYERCLKVNEKDAEALNSLASVLLAQGDKAALGLANRAVQLDANNALYIDTLGWAEFKLGTADRALPLLRDARLRQPANAEIRLHLGEVLASLGRKSEARTELAVAASSQSDPASAKLAQKLLDTLK